MSCSARSSKARGCGRTWTRRDLLRAGALVPCLSFTRTFAVQGTLRIAVVGDLPGDVKRGIELGTREAGQTARLLGRIVVVDTDVSGASAILSAQPSIRPTQDAIVVGLGEAAASPPCVFSVAVGRAVASSLLKRWIADHGEHPNLQVAEWHPSLTRFGASELNQRYAAAFKSPMTAGAWRGWFAVKAVTDAALATDGPLTCQAFAGTRFDGHKGRPLTFGPDAVLTQPLYVVSGDEVLGEIA